MNTLHATLLVLLGLSAAFDAIDRGILLERPRSAFGVQDTALSRFGSEIDGILSAKFTLEYGVPRGSCLGPLLFIVYASKIFEIVGKHFLETHCHADDSQLYLSFCPDSSVNQDVVLAKMESIDDIRNWMTNDKLKLNKTEFLIIGTSQQFAEVPISSLRVGKSVITPVATA